MTKTQPYIPALEGIRGYAFLLVFVIHYTEVYKRPSHLALYPLFLLQNTAWFLVPLFFVLSGFLITRILLNTKEREGYFRVFYFRRMVRVFPLYYLTIVPVAILALLDHWPVRACHLLYFVYLQNFSKVAFDFNHYVTANITVVHLWSLAIEEQFYLLWPIVIWLVPTEKALLRVSYGIIAACCLLRIAWPLTHLTYDSAYYYTATRVDAIILGAVLAIHHKEASHWSRLVKAARILIPTVWLTLIVLTLVRGNGLTTDYLGVSFSIPAMNLLGACFVILAIHPSGMVNRACSFDSICRVGRLSYALYLFHAIYSHLFTNVLAAKLERHLPHVLTQILVILAALAFTMMLAALAYRFVEEPGMRWKERLPYGPRRLRKPTLPESSTITAHQELDPTLPTATPISLVRSELRT